MKVIFLDIDGVLNTKETFFKRKEKHIKTKIWDDLFRIEYLKEIIEKTDAKIVLTSTWRKGFEKDNGILIPILDDALEIVEVLSKYKLEIYDITGIDKNGIRQEEIKEWLLNNPTSSFVILDDETCDLNDYLEYVIKTRDNNEQIGLCDFHIDIAVNMLNRKRLVLKNNHNSKY